MNTQRDNEKSTAEFRIAMLEKLNENNHKVLDEVAPPPVVKKAGERFNLCGKCHAMDDGVCPLLGQVYTNGYDGVEECDMFEVFERVYNNCIAAERFNHHQEGGKDE